MTITVEEDERKFRWQAFNRHVNHHTINQIRSANTQDFRTLFL